ncbi:hypothetical protein HGRIS_004028 [Hohenbuehelia grisea]|uniref:HNH nuclease domain-containing protein n=1 Tax=Hohenbuehelia grisea TaxID=104357 RepID=A0ABR3JI83_9AGAR
MTKTVLSEAYLIEERNSRGSANSYRGKRALIRDGFKCVATGKYDAGPLARANVATAEVLAAGGGWHTECAHIVPESTYFGVGNPRLGDGDADEKAQVKREYSASVLAVLQRFGYDVSRLSGPKVHSLCNVMTLCKDPHDLFDRLQMWFEATETPHTYRIITSDPWYMLPREGVTFTTHDSVKYPLPSPELLALHAACAKVAHLSGASELLDDYDRDTERLGVLDPSGASSDVLAHALAGIDIGA